MNDRATRLLLRETPLIPRRGVHLDLKGLPPTPTRLLKLLDIFAAARFNFVLVEWEDSFPWEVDRQFRSETAYTQDQVDAFHRRAAELGLDVIPLMQSLGHMDTPLRLDRYRGMREVADRCDGLNPLAQGARQLVERMVEDVIRRTPRLTHFHLGGDEALTFGTHPDTAAFVARYGKAELYLRHVEPLLDFLLARNVRPILWHDMMYDWPAEHLARLRDKADVMIWSYQGHPDLAPARYNSDVVKRLRDAGDKGNVVEQAVSGQCVGLWGATAFKGADGAGNEDVPDLDARVANALGWADVARRHAMNAVVATGWNRYATNRVQCEPIEGALDALLHVAIALHDGKPASREEWSEPLRRLGEWNRFQSCRRALAEFAAARRLTWQYVQLCHEQTCLEAREVRRRNSGVLDEFRRIARGHMDAAHAAADDVRKALHGLIIDVWLERYLSERLDPLRDAVAAL